jgi:hypothetical protein
MSQFTNAQKIINQATRQIDTIRVEKDGETVFVAIGNADYLKMLQRNIRIAEPG